MLLIISVEIMKTTDEREFSKKKKNPQKINKKAERSKGNKSYSESVRAK